MIITNTKERTRFIRFAIVGIIGAVVDFGILNLFTLVFKIPFVPSSIVSFCAAVLNNFILNHFWTYPDSRSKSVSRQLVQFALINVIGLLIRTPLLAWLEKMLIPLGENFLPPNLSATIVAHNVALAVAIGVVMLWNFFANRFWTFNDVD